MGRVYQKSGGLHWGKFLRLESTLCFILTKYRNIRNGRESIWSRKLILSFSVRYGQILAWTPFFCLIPNVIDWFLDYIGLIQEGYGYRFVLTVQLSLEMATMNFFHDQYPNSYWKTKSINTYLITFHPDIMPTITKNILFQFCDYSCYQRTSGVHGTKLSRYHQNRKGWDKIGTVTGRTGNNCPALISLWENPT